MRLFWLKQAKGFRDTRELHPAGTGQKTGRGDSRTEIWNGLLRTLQWSGAARSRLLGRSLSTDFPKSQVPVPLCRHLPGGCVRVVIDPPVAAHSLTGAGKPGS
jgi:hypothetical protein